MAGVRAWTDISYPVNTGLVEHEYWPANGQVVGMFDDDGNLQLYVVSRSRLLAGDSSSVYAVESNHLFYELGGGEPKSYLLINAIPGTVLSDILDGSRWEVGTIAGSLAALTRNFSETLRNPLEMLRIVESTYGCRLVFRAVISANTISHLYVDVAEIDATFRGQRFVFGHNLENFELSVDVSEVKTALVGVGLGDEIDPATGESLPMDFSGEVASDKPLGQTWIGSNSARQFYGIPDGAGGMSHRFGVYESSAATPAELLEATRVQLLRQSAPRVTLTGAISDLEKVKLIDFSTGSRAVLSHEKIRLGNIVQIVARAKGLLSAAEARVSRIEKDPKDGRNTVVSFGDPVGLTSNYLELLDQKIARYDSRRRALDRGKGSQTVIVGSQDTSARPWYANVIVPAGAVDSQTYIYQAINMLPDSGGRVILLEGVYPLTGAISLRNGVTVEGQGAGTILQLDSSLVAPITLNVFWRSSLHPPVADIKIANMMIRSWAGAAAAGISGHAIALDGVSGVRVENVISEYLGALLYTDNCAQIVVTGCTSRWGVNGLRISTTRDMDVSDCQFFDASANSILLMDSRNIRVVGGCSERSDNYHVAWQTVSNVSINGMYLNRAGLGAIVSVNSGKDNAILNCLIMASSQNTDLGTSHIILNDDLLDTKIIGNTFRRFSDDSNSNSARYAVRVGAAAVTRTFIISNDMYDAAGLGTIEDLGTSTTATGNKT